MHRAKLEDGATGGDDGACIVLVAAGGRVDGPPGGERWSVARSRE